MRLPRPRVDAADGVMLAVVLMWAGNNVLIKVTVGVIPPLPFVVARFLIAIVLVWAWIAWRRTPVRIAIRDVPLLVVAGASGFGFYTALFTVGMERTSAFSVALLVSLSPVFTLVLSRLAGIEFPTRQQWLAVALATAGVAVFVGDKLRAEGIAAASIGDVLGLLASFSFAVYSVAARPLTSRYGATVATGWAVVVGLIVVAPWGVPATMAFPWWELSPPIWGALFYAAAVSTLIGYTLWSWAIVRGGVARTVPYLFMIPVITGVISALFLGETFGPVKIAGALMVLVGTTLVRVLGTRGTKPTLAISTPAAPRLSSNGGQGVAAQKITAGS